MSRHLASGLPKTSSGFTTCYWCAAGRAEADHFIGALGRAKGQGRRKKSSRARAKTKKTCKAGGRRGRGATGGWQKHAKQDRGQRQRGNSGTMFHTERVGTGWVSQNLHDMRHRHLIDPGRCAATLLIYMRAPRGLSLVVKLMCLFLDMASSWSHSLLRPQAHHLLCSLQQRGVGCRVCGCPAHPLLCHALAEGGVGAAKFCAANSQAALLTAGVLLPS